MCRTSVRLLLSAFVSAILVSQVQADIILDNAHHSEVVTAGSQSNFRSQSFTLNVPGGTAGNAASHDNIGANLPLPGSLLLKSILFVESPNDNNDATAGNLFLKLFTDAGATGAPVAVSTNSIDVRGAIDGGALSDLVWNFNNDLLSSTAQYFIRWSTNSDLDNTELGVARVAAANFGGGFVNTYTGGVATNPAGGTLNFDARFEVTVAVPEPSSAAVLGLCSLLMASRRRR